MMHLKRISISISAIATKAASMGICKAVSMEMTKAVEKGAFLLACLLMLGGASANAQNQKKKMATVEKDTIIAMVLGSQFFLAGFLGDLISRQNPNRNDYQIEKEIRCGK
jgi:hypothetical protein